MASSFSILALLALPAAPPDVGELLAITADARLTGPGRPAEVRVESRLRLPTGDRALPLAAVALPPARLREVRLEAAGQTLPLAAAWPDGIAVDLVVELPEELSGKTIELTARYLVDGAWPGEGDAAAVRLPLLMPPWPPAPEAMPFFVGEIHLPPGVAWAEPFPATLTETVDDGGRHLRCELPVAPSLLRLRLGPPAGPAKALLYGAIAVALGGIGLAGWWAVRRSP